ncbi:hypothetical protein Mapa_011890 [Marchantia paleacea]|nr:hypothetical protein Mapa_011890 [Marchantia paleacea]
MRFPTFTEKIGSYHFTDNLRELAIEISLTSLGSNQTLRCPHFSTLAASRFCSLRDTMVANPVNEEGEKGGRSSAVEHQYPREKERKF